jgi:hypothetical protein
MSRLMLAVVDVHGRDAELEVRVRLDTVEFWAQERCWAVFDRGRLRNWLAAPEGVCAVDDVALAPADTRIGLTVNPLVPWWPIEPLDLATLRRSI